MIELVIVDKFSIGKNLLCETRRRNASEVNIVVVSFPPRQFITDNNLFNCHAHQMRLTQVDLLSLLEFVTHFGFQE